MHWDTTHYVFELVLIADYVLKDVIDGERLPAALTQEECALRHPSTLPHRAQAWWGHTGFKILHAFVKLNVIMEVKSVCCVRMDTPTYDWCRVQSLHLQICGQITAALSSFPCWKAYKITNPCIKRQKTLTHKCLTPTYCNPWECLWCTVVCRSWFGSREF